MKRLLVIGASAGIGLATTRTALGDGWQVRALSRQAPTMALEHHALEKIAGDARNKTVVSAALADVDAVVLTLGVPISLRLLTGPITLFSEATAVLLDALRESRCRRLVAITGFGAGSSEASIHPLQKPFFRLAFGVAYRDKSRQEAMIMDSDLDWTIVRPGVFSNSTARSSYRVLMRPDEWRNGIVQRQSVAELILRAIHEDAFIGTSPVVIN